MLDRLLRSPCRVSRDSHLRQNFSGTKFFLSAGSANEKFSIFEAIDEFSQSLNYDMSSGTSSNLLSQQSLWT